ncbi:hypothetical protein [Aquimarina mytili]|uniref:Cytochrome c domain-containing protein n=1 Tax=Aquimarina mytili TaxID=874423 RepID=A0A937D7A3_9FLAO|nr:hypothetical protein [Aquimarina mytili]MBL0682885.1 hypothetical protein [Aquimarina mytili]
MFIHTKIWLLSFALVVLVLRTCVQDMSTSEVTDIVPPLEEKKNISTKISNENSFEECSEITRGVLITFCGSCHQSSLDSHKAGAIQVFDLDKMANWHTSLSEENLNGIARRTQNKDITDQKKEAIATFIKLKELQLE